ncbi:MAG TPA: hypothetical protein VFC08_04955 [Actinomycetota bacterium]|nr:hypothetical protein [Actinomycetota bacterium]
MQGEGRLLCRSATAPTDIGQEVLLASLVAATRLRGGRSILLMLGAMAVVAGAFLLVSRLDLI